MSLSIKKNFRYLRSSLNFAIRGIRYAWRTEQNFRWEIAFAVLVILSSILLPLRPIEQLLSWLLIIWVLTLEIINTVLERMIDIIKPKKHPYIGAIKDLMAGAVLVSAAGSAVIGMIIFFPYLANLISTLLN